MLYLLNFGVYICLNWGCMEYYHQSDLFENISDDVTEVNLYSSLVGELIY